MKKKGELNKIIVSLVLVLFVLFILFIFYTDLFETFYDKKHKNECKQALYMASLSNIKNNDFLNFFGGFGSGSDSGNVPCKINVKKITTGDKEDVKKEIANLMYDSWDMMHMGQLDFVSGRKTETYCIITDVIEFEDDSKNIGEIDNFLDYLSEKKITNPSFEDTTYLEYLQCYNTVSKYFDDKIMIEHDFDFNIDTNQDYAIMFVYSREGYLHRIWAGMKGAGAGGVIGGVLAVKFGALTGGVGIIVLGVAGAGIGYEINPSVGADWSSCIILIPYEENFLSELNCTYMPGIFDTR